MTKNTLTYCEECDRLYNEFVNERCPVCCVGDGLFGGRSARMNPDDPAFMLNPDGFESLIIRKWRHRLERQHMAAEGIQ